MTQVSELATKLKAELVAFKKEVEEFFSYFDHNEVIVAEELPKKVAAFKARVDQHVADNQPGMIERQEQAAMFATEQDAVTAKRDADAVASGVTLSGGVKPLEKMSVEEMLLAGYSEAQVEAIQSARANEAAVPDWASLPNKDAVNPQMTHAGEDPSPLGLNEAGERRTEDELREGGYTEDQIIGVLLAREEADKPKE